MSIFKYIIRSITHYAKLNLATILGIALSTAILVGALIVGDSVKFSLQQIAVERLGATEKVITAGERIFTLDLSIKLRQEKNLSTSSLLRANGIAIIDGGKNRLNKIQVWGVDKQFGDFSDAPQKYKLQDNEVAINQNLASSLNLTIGDEFLLRVNKVNTFPSNTPFVSAEENTVSFRVKLKEICNKNELGNFNLQNIQSSPRNVFVDINWLNEQLDLSKKANVILIADSEEKKIDELLSSIWSLDDINLKLRHNNELNYDELISDRIFLEPELTNLKANNSKTELVFSYFVNEFQFLQNKTPYSFISTIDKGLNDSEIIINEWLANDLKAKAGDELTIKYYEVGPLRKLIEKSEKFKVQKVVPMEDYWGDKYLMPEIPGLSDAGHCRDWESGIPVDLNSIRPKDEDYWNKYKGTPKAFISLNKAKELWSNRFGNATALRFENSDPEELKYLVLSTLKPSELGFQMQNAKEEGLKAASNGVDFGGLFIGLSFFVLLAAVLLTILLFRLFLDYRRNEIGTLKSLGFREIQIRNIFLTEAVVLVIIGILLGIPAGLMYNKFILSAVNSIWVDIVRTSIVYINIRLGSLLLGAISIFLISIGIIVFLIHRFLKRELVELQKSYSSKKPAKVHLQLILGLFFTMGSIALVLFSGTNKGQINPELFFISGFGLLPGLILLINYLFIRLNNGKAKSTLKSSQLIWRQIIFNRKQNVLIIAFLSVGIFMVISTGLNRKDLSKNADKNFSGTGGYDLFIETTMPILYDLNDAKVADNFGLQKDDRLEFAQFRVKQGDDASCLNLNLISKPQLIACDPQIQDARKSFTFITKTDDLSDTSPWLSLQQKTKDGFIPAIADQTVIKWGLGKSVGDTLNYINENGQKLELKLIGGLANSIFQGNVIIAEKFFISNYPSVSGSNILLVDLNGKTDVSEELIHGFRNYGAEITPTIKRLFEFYKIENTYLNIFLLLGALGLLIGTIGLAILIFRIETEKSRNYAILLAVGFTRKKVYKIAFIENLIIISLAIFAGLLPSALSAIPSATSQVYHNLIWMPLAIILIVFVCAIVWTAIAVFMATRKRITENLRVE